MEESCGCVCEYCNEHRAERVDRKSGLKLCPDCLRKMKMNEDKSVGA
jgi:hypothetical protein